MERGMEREGWREEDEERGMEREGWRERDGERRMRREGWREEDEERGMERAREASPFIFIHVVNLFRLIDYLINQGNHYH